MVRFTACITGIILLAVGIGGFFPGIVWSAKLFGVFYVDSALNIVRTLSGILFLLAAQQARWSRNIFQVMGLVYSIFTVSGFLVGQSGLVLGLFRVNTMDNLLHLLLAAVFIYYGFGIGNQPLSTQSRKLQPPPDSVL